ncbi:MAG: threonine synthase [Candidatus Hecatellaceae archaeon]
MFHLECIVCGEKHGVEEPVYVCRKCGELLDVKYDYRELRGRLSKASLESRPLSVWRYRELLPILDDSKIVSLREGGTKLHHCQRLGEKLGLKRLYVKTEGDNPTGSFKDRGMTVGITKALEYGMKAVMCASTGNTSASLAAYAAKAGIPCFVVIPAGKIAFGKLAQAVAYGAKIIQIEGNFDDALRLVMEASTKGRIYLLNSVNPYRVEGQKTLAYEVVDQLGGQAPSKLIVPVGNAGNISAIWKGFKEYLELGFADRLPQMFGVQASGAAPIVEAVREGAESIRPVEKPETVATAIRIGAPVNWRKALRAIRESNGAALAVADSEILEGQRMLARLEGLFVEPASAASIAGLKKFVEEDLIGEDEIVVCVATGHGLKDPDTPVKFGEKPLEVEGSLEEVERILEV